MTRLRATAAHVIPERPPMQVLPGQRVQAGQHDTQWPAFVFVTTDDSAGWVPERYLDTPCDPAVVITGYDTTELATTAGEELTLIKQDTPSGWAWVRNAAGPGGMGAIAHRRANSRRMTGHPMTPSLWTRDMITSSVVLHRRSQAEVLLP
jgi:hypothetical protein